MSVRRAVGNLDGVDDVNADPNTKIVTISFDPSVIKLSDIEKTLSEEGFPVAK